ncbi:putative Histone deacetylase complex subunit SAP18 [Hypsibius exemplaris]|uniref:18 kDa Sin3-associated polypeptide n=1 Tax=Hypsibius exemplaris TaxID=2072580 RepID=A0A1W0XCG8_HYPEX|nr:putative Histone deacetylase complex subunit SAP18 [Hypsibius exemplaris]
MSLGGTRLESQISLVTAPQARERRAIDREKACPTLIRVIFNVNGRHVHPGDLKKGILPKDAELHIHTWMDASLREISMLIREMLPEARRPGTRMDFDVLVPEPFGRGYRKSHLGAVFIGHKTSIDDQRTLEDVRFQVGELLDVAISGHLPPGVHRGPPPRGGGGDRDRDRGDRDRDNKRR